tara:strand:- start:303 stop:566 length:264 start_codon:yes stop_codon:yes gene_type:complete
VAPKAALAWLVLMATSATKTVFASRLLAMLQVAPTVVVRPTVSALFRHYKMSMPVAMAAKHATRVATTPSTALAAPASKISHVSISA